MKKKTIIGIVVAVVAVVAIGAGVAYAQSAEQQRVNQEREQSAQNAYEGFEVQLNDIQAEDVEARTALIDKLQSLESLRQAVENGKDSLALPDGGYRGYDDLVASITQVFGDTQKLIVKSFETDCTKAVSAATAEGATKDVAAASKASLQTLLEEATAAKDKGAWESDEAFNTFKAEVEESIQKCDAKVSEIQAAEEKAEAERVAAEEAAAAEAAAQSAQNSSSDYGYSSSNGGSDYSYSYDNSGSAGSSGSNGSSGSAGGGGYHWDLGNITTSNPDPPVIGFDANGNPIFAS